ncbi:MAG: DUF5110 domain-containing protein [Lachnospiraceae bacterium]|nr:DUF5110 domain-containing protein [Lachnospiraceae bacterium]
MILNEHINVPAGGKYGLSICYSNATGSDKEIILSAGGNEKVVLLKPTLNEFTYNETSIGFSLLPKVNDITVTTPDDTPKGLKIDTIRPFRMFEPEDAEIKGSLTLDDCKKGIPVFLNDGDEMIFKIRVSSAGKYAIRFHYGAIDTDSEPQSLTVRVNDINTTHYLASLRDYNARSNSLLNVSLKKGVNIVSLVKGENDTGNIILDYLGLYDLTPTYIGDIFYVKKDISSPVFVCENADVMISAEGSNSVRIFADPSGRFERTYASFTVINDLPASDFSEFTESKEYYTLSLKDFSLRIFKKPFRIEYIDNRGNVIAANDQRSMGWTETGECFVNNRIFPNERFYGLGEKLAGFEHTGQKMQMWAVDAYGNPNDSSVPSWENGKWYMSNPYFISNRGYSILFDNSSFTEFDMGNTDPSICTFGSRNPNPGGDLIYFFIYGPSIKKLTKTFTDLAGKSFFAPKWALGNIQCHYGYTQADIERVAKTYRANSIPIDVILSDIEWYEYLCAPTMFSRKNYPDPDRMFKTLSDLNIRYGLINDPNVTDRDNNPVFEEGEKNGYFVKDITGNTKKITWPWGGPSGLVDFFNPEASKWWGSLLETILDRGVSCMWLDMNEPSKYNPDWFFWNEEGKSYGSFNEVKNAYAIMHQKAVYNKMTEGGNRSFLQTRSGYCGTHRYAAPWTGDIQGSFESMHEQLILGLGLSLTGYNYWGFDIGGFFTSLTDNMYKRWVELATFTPIHRFHYCEGVEEKEPWTHNSLDVSIKYINLRYQMIPYMYSITADSIIGIGLEETGNSKGSGLPIVRPMLMEFPDDSETYGIDYEFMCGPSLLVAPVCDDSETKQVYLPKGIWYDHSNPSRLLNGGKYINYPAPYDVLPLFVKEGSIIPSQSERQFMDDPNASDTITFDIYPTLEDSVFSFVLYEDDGKTDRYTIGEYALTSIKCTVRNSLSEDLLEVVFKNRTGFYKDIPERDYIIKLHCRSYFMMTVTKDSRVLKRVHGNLGFANNSECFLLDATEQVCTVKIRDNGSGFTLLFVGSRSCPQEIS